MATLFVNNLTVLDFSLLDAERGMLGESWIVDVELSGELDDAGMVFDFGVVRKHVKDILDDCLDHKLAVPTLNDALQELKTSPEVALTWRYNKGLIAMQAPACSTAAIPVAEINIDAVTPWLEEQVLPHMPSNVTGVKLHLRLEEMGSTPFYHYSHGLKKHDGNCQRIAHGHRSRIEIFTGNERATQWEKEWARRWHDIYIGSKEDLKEIIHIEGAGYYVFEYTANQGYFSLTLPIAHCYLIDTDSTVEFLAEHIAQQLAQEAPEQAFYVRAYEGVGKGAIARSNG
ncbi:MAG TPA: 6-carboxytetrahydropterin synthase [Alcanivoracaceae bacterium]|nr:6-carboxytetrahydropterin synthase [Alcanivoracaceae bacterium]